MSVNFSTHFFLGTQNIEAIAIGDDTVLLLSLVSLFGEHFPIQSHTGPGVGTSRLTEDWEGATLYFACFIEKYLVVERHISTSTYTHTSTYTYRQTVTKLPVFCNSGEQRRLQSCHRMEITVCPWSELPASCFQVPSLIHWGYWLLSLMPSLRTWDLGLPW